MAAAIHRAERGDGSPTQHGGMRTGRRKEETRRAAIAAGPALRGKYPRPPLLVEIPRTGGQKKRAANHGSPHPGAVYFIYRYSVAAVEAGASPVAGVAVPSGRGTGPLPRLRPPRLRRRSSLLPSGRGGRASPFGRGSRGTRASPSGRGSRGGRW